MFSLSIYSPYTTNPIHPHVLSQPNWSQRFRWSSVRTTSGSRWTCSGSGATSRPRGSAQRSETVIRWSGDPRGKPWENHGNMMKIMGKPWEHDENHGKTTGKWWFNWKTIGKSWENHVIWWDLANFGNVLEFANLTMAQSKIVSFRSKHLICSIVFSMKTGSTNVGNVNPKIGGSRLGSSYHCWLVQ